MNGEWWGGLMALWVLLLAAALVFWLDRLAKRTGKRAANRASALRFAKKFYARRVISKKQFERLKKELT